MTHTRLPVTHAVLAVRAMTKEEPSFEIYRVEDLTVIIPKDPVWDPALEELRKLGDPRGIARLLKDEVPLPAHIGRSLGIMLDPPDGYKGVRLYSSGKAGVEEREKAIETLLNQKRLGEQIRALQEGRKVESAVAEAHQKFGISRSSFFEMKKFDQLEVVFQSQKIFGYVDRPGIKSKKNKLKARPLGRKSRKK